MPHGGHQFTSYFDALTPRGVTSTGEESLENTKPVCWLRSAGVARLGESERGS